MAHRAWISRHLPVVIAVVGAIAVVSIIAIELFMPAFKVPASLTRLYEQANAPDDSPPRRKLSAAEEQQSVWLGNFWSSLLSDSDDRRVAALQMLRDVPEIGTYPVNGRTEWTDKGMLVLAIDDKTIDSDFKSFIPMFKQVIPALAAGSPPFADWDPAVRSNTLLALQNCAINLRQFALSMNSVSNPPQVTFMPKMHSLHNLQLDLCLKSSFIRTAILQAAEKEHVPGFDSETLRERQQALKEDRKKDSALMHNSMQEFNQLGEDFGSVAKDLKRQDP